MHESCVSFYAPLTKSPCLEIAFIDIQQVRPLDAGGLSPLPGFPLLVLETAWLCYYLAFRDEEARDTFGDLVDNAITKHIQQGTCVLEFSFPILLSSRRLTPVRFEHNSGRNRCYSRQRSTEGTILARLPEPL